ncbi:hypothetical protein [Phenylobacterium sp. SCN 70-31]|uniref:hypothetical protein n=1 Tax=Phenylobacterium sp. SCN 70-31 TaxID=1660129 RepID=UPI00086C487A|nr:hypothetical protein [Phenylobacterium sp. SCN 70-31]ODT87036.1 MAG: hypothetical protein ABS78_13385 [Phenylobacterium sp. SCN 70-31]
MTEITDIDRARAEEARARHFAQFAHSSEAESEAEIAAMLARIGWEPVDPDLIATRELCAEDARRCGFGEWMAVQYLSGRRDSCPLFQRSLAAIKRGRQLEREAGR